MGIIKGVLYDEEDFEVQQSICESIDDDPTIDEPQIDEEEERQIKITDKFLNGQLKIQCEKERTLLKFSYKNINYEGKVISKLKGTKYVFLIESPIKGLKAIDIENIE